MFTFEEVILGGYGTAEIGAIHQWYLEMVALYENVKSQELRDRIEQYSVDVKRESESREAPYDQESE